MIKEFLKEFCQIFLIKSFNNNPYAQLIKKFNIPIVPVYIERLKNINFKIVIHEPINFEDNATTENITEDLNNNEKMVKNNPEQWIWSHNR